VWEKPSGPCSYLPGESAKANVRHVKWNEVGIADARQASPACRRDLHLKVGSVVVRSLPRIDLPSRRVAEIDQMLGSCADPMIAVNDWEVCGHAECWYKVPPRRRDGVGAGGRASSQASNCSACGKFSMRCGLNFYSRRGGRALRTLRHRHGASCGDVGKEVMAY